jgi:hypothetical protein
MNEYQRLTREEMRAILRDCPYGLGPSASGALRIAEEVEQCWAELVMKQAHIDRLLDANATVKLRFAAFHATAAFAAEDAE